MSNTIETAKEKITALRAKYDAGKRQAVRLSEGHQADPETFGFWTSIDDAVLTAASNELAEAESAAWTLEGTIECRAKWNAAVRSIVGGLTIQKIRTLEAQFGFTAESLKSAIKKLSKGFKS